MLSVKTRKKEVKIASGGDAPEFRAMNWATAVTRQAKVTFLSWKMSSPARGEKVLVVLVRGVVNPK